MGMYSYANYFDRWGFEDGDNTELTEASFKRRNRAKGKIQEEIYKQGLKWKVRIADVSNSHNKARLFLEYEGGKYWDYEVKERYVRVVMVKIFESLFERGEYVESSS